MLEQFRLSVGLTYARFHFGRSAGPVIHFTEALTNARKVLVFLPESDEHAEFHSVLEFLTKHYTPQNIVTVSHEHVSASWHSDARMRMILFKTGDINRWFLPRNELLRTVKKSTFDVAIDLNVGVALPSAYLCRASQASIRVGFTKDHADFFYNLQIQTQHTHNLGAAYHALIHCFKML